MSEIVGGCIFRVASVRRDFNRVVSFKFFIVHVYTCLGHARILQVVCERQRRNPQGIKPEREFEGGAYVF